MDLERVLLGEDGALVLNSEIRMSICLMEKCIGKVCLCKLFRKSEVILMGSISEMRIIIGFGLGLAIGIWGCGKGCGKVGKGWGFAGVRGCGKVGGSLWRKFGVKCA
jgi:hypothetical protein